MVERRTDLDALRGIAMILGIVLHASASFVGFPWVTHELQSTAWIAILMTWIHGFRMPLFFMLSGFFTQLFYETRGLQALVRQRVDRIAIPLGPLCCNRCMRGEWLGARWEHASTGLGNLRGGCAGYQTRVTGCI